MDGTTPHPNGPRTFGTFLRDAVPMPAAVLERLVALESGLHPTLTDMRAALGLDLSLAAWADAARQNWSRGENDPDDAALARLIDALYASLSSRRMIRAARGNDGLRLSRAEGAIALREGERLTLLLLVENRTDALVDCSAEARGQRVTFSVEAGRAGSILLDAGPLPRGSYLLPVTVAAGGTTATADVPIEASPAGVLAMRLVDDEAGDPVAARVYLADGVGPAWPEGATIRRDVHGAAFFHADGSFAATVSGTANVRVVRGIEYEPAEAAIDVPADGRAERTLRLRRWSHMAADGWYSGDVHVHLHYGGEYELTPADAALVQRAEDVNFMNMMVANQGSGWVHDEPYFSGAPHELSAGAHMLRWGEEYRNDFYGHMCMFGIRELVPPIYSGFRESAHPRDLPANADAARHCHSVGGTLSYAHPLFAPGDLDRVFAHARTVEAKELPVDAALGLIDAVDVMSYPGHEMETARLWYRLLNCGLRLAATAGTDTFMNWCDNPPFSNPPAGDRVFARVDGAFTTESWCEAVRHGRTFVTDGPMLSLRATAAGQTYEIGGDVRCEPGTRIDVVAEAGSYAPMEVLELIVNGEVVASSAASDAGRRAALQHEFAAAESCWIALRSRGPTHPLVLDSELFAHTSPIYVTVGGAPVSRPEDAAYFFEWIGRLIATTETKGSYATPAEREGIAALFREGQAYYARIAGIA